MLLISKYHAHYQDLTINSLSASQLVATDANKKLVSDISGIAPTFANVTISGLSASQLVATDASKQLVSDTSSIAPTFAGLSVNANAFIAGSLFVRSYVSIAQANGETGSIQCHFTDSRASIGLSRWSNNTGGGGHWIAKSRGTSVNSNAIVQNGDTLGRFVFSGDDGTDLRSRAASIDAIVNGVPGVDDMPGALLFKTTPSGSTTPATHLGVYADGSTCIGDGGTTNYTEIESDGTLEMHGAATVYEDMQVSISNVRLPAADFPSWEDYAFGIGGGVTFPVLGFDVGEHMFFDVQSSHSMTILSILDNHVHFTLPNTTDVGDKFKFQLDVIAAAIDAQWAVPAGSPFTSEHTIVANDNTYHRLMEIADIPAVNATVSTIYKCKLSRIAASSDEYGSLVYITFTDCHYNKNTLGSRDETVK